MNILNRFQILAVDYFISLPREEYYRVARFMPITWLQSIKDFFWRTDPRAHPFWLRNYKVKNYRNIAKVNSSKTST